MKVDYEIKKEVAVVAAIIYDEHNRILCTKRGASHYPYTAFKYEFPGGKIEPGETPREALRRELMEEMQMKVEVGPLVAEVHHRYPHFSIKLMAFHCTASPLRFVLKEHIDVQILPLSRLRELDWAAADEAVIDVLEIKSFSK